MLTGVVTPLSLPLTTEIIWIAAAVVLLLLVIPIFLTRAFYVKKNVRLQGRIKELEDTNRDLGNRLGAFPKQASRDEKSEKGWVQQLVSVVVAVGGLAGLLTAFVPLLDKIQDMEKSKSRIEEQQSSLSFFNGMVGFTEAKWKEVSNSPPSVLRANPKPRDFSYEGQDPKIVDIEKGSIVKFVVPANGARILLRPRPAPK